MTITIMVNPKEHVQSLKLFWSKQEFLSDPIPPLHTAHYFPDQSSVRAIFKLFLFPHPTDRACLSPSAARQTDQPGQTRGQKCILERVNNVMGN
jgi:hypothetical protein